MIEIANNRIRLQSERVMGTRRAVTVHDLDRDMTICNSGFGETRDCLICAEGYTSGVCWDVALAMQSRRRA